MKFKFLLIALLGIALMTSCKKESITPEKEEPVLVALPGEDYKHTYTYVQSQTWVISSVDYLHKIWKLRALDPQDDNNFILINNVPQELLDDPAYYKIRDNLEGTFVLTLMVVKK